MTTNTQQRVGGHAVTTKITAADVRSRWGKFDEAELAMIGQRAELVQRIQDKYGLTKDRANQDVEAWAKGRVF
jgi:uncharacterized protein YjbJ (UPF0337 family)